MHALALFGLARAVWEASEFEIDVHGGYVQVEDWWDDMFTKLEDEKLEIFLTICCVI